jgi:DNA-binding NarL/FixJ family response regulator
MVKVLIIDDHELLAESLRISLTAEGFEVLVPAVRADQVLAAAQSLRPEVVLLDLDLGESGGDGGALVEPLVVGGASVIVVSATESEQRVAACLEGGAAGYVSKSAPLEDLLGAVRTAAAGGPVMSDARRQDMLSALHRSRAHRRKELAPFGDLTSRERYVLAQAMDGQSAADIAATAFVSEATVRSQIRAVLTKLGVRSQLAAVAAAHRVGWEPAPRD